MAVGGVLGAWLHWHHTPNKAPMKTGPVPTSIARAVDFPIYYPDPRKLPAGYSLDTHSFSNPVKNGVAYSVNYGSGKKIIFSAQNKPSDNELSSFKANYIPINNESQTPVGQAVIGAYNNHGTLETLVSLPTNGKTWLVITAPYDINQDQLKQVLNSIKQNS